MLSNRVFVACCIAVVALSAAVGINKLRSDAGRVSKDSYSVQFGVNGFSGEERAGASGKAGRSIVDSGAPSPSSEWRSAARAAVAKADGMGGISAVAIWADGWSSPVVAGAGSERNRMWSMSKPVTAVALIEKLREKSQLVPPATMDAMRRAIRRSENCRQRHVVVALQEASNGDRAAIEDFEATLSEAGAQTVKVSKRLSAPPASCVDYLASQGGVLEDPVAVAAQFGIATWMVRDAVSFMHFLGNGGYGESGKLVTGLMTTPKQVSSEIASAGEYTAEKDWGAGRVFAGLRPAYKAGWGGVQQQRFVAGQIVYVRVGGRGYAIAATFRPNVQPELDDPGRTAAPRALEAIFSTLRTEM